VLERYARDLTRFAEQSRATSTTILDDSTRPTVWGRLCESLSILREASTATTIFKLRVLPGHHAAQFENLQAIAETPLFAARTGRSRHRHNLFRPASTIGV
jgi:hypothetical protein